MDNENNNSGALVTSDNMAAQYGLNLNIKQVQWVGETFANSGLFADSKDKAAAMVKIMAGQELGVTPFAAMNGINIIKGRISMSGNLIAAAVKRHPRYDYRITHSDEKLCSIKWFEVFNGKREEIGDNAFTIEMAKAAGLSFASDSNWSKYPKAMLFNRAVSAGQKMFAPDVFMMSVYTEGELDDGYIPQTDSPKQQAARERVVIPQEPAKDEPFESAQAPADATDVDEPTLSNDKELYDEETEKPLAKTENKVDKRVVDATFKKKVRATLDTLGLSPTERLRLLKNSTGRVSIETLKNDEWLKFSDAIDDMMIEMADEVTAAETPVEKNNGGTDETETDTNTQAPDA